MRPISPVIPGEKIEEVVYGKDQPDYQPLPAIRGDDGTVLTRWKCSLRDRLRVFLKGDIYVWMMTFNEPLQPIRLDTKKPRYNLVFAFKDRAWDWFRWAFNLNRKFGWVKTPGGWLCWDFTPDSTARIYWSRDATPTIEAGVRVILR